MLNKRSAQLAEVKLPGRSRRRSRASDKHPALTEAGLKRYWDLRSKDYADDTGIDPAVYSSIVEYLLREGVFLPGDTVLDVGCGPGTFSLLFADGAKAVAGLDVSEGMLSKMMGSAKASGMDNVRAICSSWEKYDGKKKFDLVFSSFCPGVNDADTLLRMEERSRRSCCYLTSGDPGSEILADGLWELLTGKCPERTPDDALYLFNILYFSGRSPNLRFFKYEYNVAIPAPRLTGQFIAYFEMYMELDRHTRNKITDYINSHSTDGVYRKSARETVCAIHWDV